MLRHATRPSPAVALAVLLAPMLALGLLPSEAQEQSHAQWIREHCSKTELMVPMRDGVRLYPGDAPDSDTCDVRMGGYQMHLAGEVMRGRYRNGFTQPEAMVSGEITPVAIDLRDRYHTFKAGHRIMVQVQSSWFPAYDRNPQSFVDIYHARAEDYRAATQTVFRSADHPSHLVLGVLGSR